jgi:hypothetical protein
MTEEYLQAEQTIIHRLGAAVLERLVATHLKMLAEMVATGLHRQLQGHQ